MLCALSDPINRTVAALKYPACVERFVRAHCSGTDVAQAKRQHARRAPHVVAQFAATRPDAVFSWSEPEWPFGVPQPASRRAVLLYVVQVTGYSSGASYRTILLAAAEPDPVPPYGFLFGRRSASFDTWGQYPLPVPSAALIHAWIATNLPDDDPPWSLWTRRVLAPGTYNQRQFPARPLFWRMGTALTLPDPRVDVRKAVRKGRPPFNEYDPVIIVN